MNLRPPKLTYHKWTKQYRVRYMRTDFYLGTVYEEAHKRYLEHLKRWAEWRALRNTRKFPPLRSEKTLADIAEEFLQSKKLATGSNNCYYLTKHLKRWLHFYGAARPDVITVRHIQRLVDDMLEGKYAPKTINHDLTAIKALLDYAAGMGYMTPLPHKIVRKLPTGPALDVSLKRTVIQRLVRTAPPDLAPALALCYLCLMRPSELVAVSLGLGEWVQRGVFKLARGKMDLQSQQPRHIIFSDEALAWFPRLPRRWSRLDCFSARARKSCGPYVGVPPSLLRHSAAKHLHLAGATREHVDLLLGHKLPRVSVIYNPPFWRALRTTAARLTLKLVSARASSSA